jgi:hypothetical protein
MLHKCFMHYNAHVELASEVEVNYVRKKHKARKRNILTPPGSGESRGIVSGGIRPRTNKHSADNANHWVEVGQAFFIISHILVL